MGKEGKSKKKPLHEYPEMQISTKVYTHMGMDSMRLHAIHTLDDSIVLSCAANAVLFVNIGTGNINAMQGPERGGIGAVCVHPKRTHFAVCEKRPEKPNCVVYEYPSKKVRSVLRNGAERGYSACRFNQNGSLLATVAIEPDFVITIWAWESESIVLRNKAFGADVYNAAFNPFNDGLMVTGGSGHIKFWSMASTFTGLKLQGHIGKFGRTEISDISAFISMPDGKVVSGSESGMLLLWEGNLIKCELGRAVPDNEEHPVTQCHAGCIYVVELVEDNRILLTGGEDGYFRYWGLDTIDAAENSGGDQATPIRMLHETKVGNGVSIRCITRSVDGTFWIIQDSAGSIRRSPYMTYDAIMHAANNPGSMQDRNDREPLLRFNSGGIHAVISSPTDHVCITGGHDRSIRLIDYIHKTEVFQVRFNASVSHLQFISPPGAKEHRTFLAAFEDGSVRILRRARNTFELLSQQRPHQEKIVAWAVDDKAEQLWTISQNREAFYFQIRNNGTELVPVGFCLLPEQPTCAEFGVHYDRVYIGFTTGNIIALNAPDPATIDHNVGFQFTPTWEGVGYRQKRLPPKKDKKKINPDGFNEAAEASSSDDDLQEEQDNGPWAVLFIRRLPSNNMLVGLKNAELCYEYKFSRMYPDNAMCAPPPPNGIEREDRVEEPGNNLGYRTTLITGATVSHSKAKLVLRTDKSNLIVRPMSKVLECYHSTQLHDALDNRLSSATTSFDDRLLISVGLDGMLFVHEIEGIEAPTSTDAATHDHLPIVAVPTVAAVPNSIQRQKEIDDKTKAEEAAMGKKHLILRKIHAVHAEFNKLLDANEAEKDGRRVPREELILDPEVLALLDAKKEAAVKEAHLEYQWVSAKKATLMKKLKAAYVDTLKWERFELRGFANGITLTSFRAPHLTPLQLQNLEMVNEMLRKEEEAAKESEAASDAAAKGSPNYQASPSLPASPNLRDPNNETHTDPTLRSTMTRSEKHGASGAVKSQLEKAEERKRERIERSRGMKALEERNPRLHPDDPAAKASILRAEKHMGDRVLKTSPDYKLPENQQPTSRRKAIQLILLESSINELRCKFNERIIEMRDVKRNLCDAINADRRRIQEIAAILKIDVDSSLVTLAPEEQPEKRFEIDREGLEKFGMEAEKQRKRAEALERAKKGFGADLATMEEDEEPSTSGEGQSVSGGKPRRSSVSALAVAHATGAQLGAKDKFELDLRARQEALRRSEVEEEENLILKETLLYERARLERRIKKSIQTFDESLDDLYHEKLKLESDLCMADMRVLLLFREYLLLLDFKKKDENLDKRKKQREKEYQEKTVMRQQESNALAQKDAEVANADSILADLKVEFDEMVADLPRGALADLETVYTRKIKRRRFDDDDDDDDESSDDDEEDEEEDFGEEGDDQCPHGIDEETFKAVLALRERRLDQVDRKAELAKEVSKMKDRLQKLTREENDLNEQLRKVTKEIDDFQKEKQKELNQLETVVVLKLSQIRCLDENGKLPPEYTDDYVVFTQHGLEELQQRIVDLDGERQQLALDSKQMDQEIAKLTRRRAKRFAEYTEWDSKVYEVQLLKFGQRVNLEMLENIAVDRETEELKAALKAEEIRWERELAKQAERLQQLKMQQQQRIAENTAALKDLGSFRAEQRDLEEALKHSAAKIVAKMTGGSKVATAADRAHLKDLVVAQQQEIDALKNEIAMLRRKGGHVYTPVVAKVSPPPPPASA